MCIPESLYLKGFSGICDGLHRDEITLDLLALTGGARVVCLYAPNGGAKTTILENLHPWLCMPYRVKGKLSGFTYYNEVYLPENIKRLVWRSVDGKRYKTEVVIRLVPRQSTEAYLLEEKGKSWTPVTLPDGTRSDGKTSTYKKCLEAIEGSAETFFASAFAAQNRRHLSEYDNAEAKDLLCDLLAHGNIRILGRQAGEVVKLVRAGLITLQQQRGTLAASIEHATAGVPSMADADEQLRLAQAEYEELTAAQERAHERLVHAQAAEERGKADAQRRANLVGDRTAAEARHRLAADTFERQDRMERDRLAELDRRIAARHDRRKRQVRSLSEQLQRQRGVLEDAARVERALRRLPLAQNLVALRETRLVADTEQLEALQEARNELTMLQERRQRINQNALERSAQLRTRLQALQVERERWLDRLGDREAVERAARRLPAARARVAHWEQALGLERQRRDRLVQTEHERTLASERLDAISREAGEQTLRAESLRKRFALADRVPCRGTALQSGCELLGDAREARQMLPAVDFKLSDLARQRSELLRLRRILAAKQTALADAHVQVARAERWLEAARRRLDVLNAKAAQCAALDQAQAAVARIDRQLRELGHAPQGPTADEIAQCNAIDVARLRLLERFGGAESDQQLREVLAEARQRRSWSHSLLEAARARVLDFSERAARAGQLAQARTESARIEEELRTLAAQADGDNAAEAAERQQIVDVRAALRCQRCDAEAGERAELARIDHALAALPAPWDPARLQACTQAHRSAVAARAAAEAARDAARAAVARVRSAAERVEQLRAEQHALDARIAVVEQKLSAWILMDKCLGPDGVMALLIDDAGPALAAKANELLLAGFGPRFTLSIETQVESARGEAREGFRILVFDADSPRNKPKHFNDLSGGERIWINEALTRAIALHIAEHGGRRHGTLFSDETDGALDSERKRIYMAMKRKVLDLGRYQHEYFITQTPELAKMADVVIDLTKLRQTGMTPRAAGQSA